MTRILLVEDSDEHAGIVEHALAGRKGWEVVRAVTRKEAMLQAARQAFDAAIVDYRLPDGDGIDLLDALRAQNPGLPILFLTAHGSEEVAMEAMRRGAADYVAKGPHYQRDLPRRVEEVLARAEDLARVAAAVKHSREAAGRLRPSAQLARAPPRPAPRPALVDPRAAAKAVKALVGGDVLGAAVLDADGNVVAAEFPGGPDPMALGPSLAGAFAQSQSALRHVPGAGPARVLLLDFEAGLLALAPMPGGALVAVLLDAATDRATAVARARDAARRVWEASRR